MLQNSGAVCKSLETKQMLKLRFLKSLEVAVEQKAGRLFGTIVVGGVRHPERPTFRRSELDVRSVTCEAVRAGWIWNCRNAPADFCVRPCVIESAGPAIISKM